MTTAKSTEFKPPTLTRSSVANILNISALTLRNREDKDIYPSPARHENNDYRIYSVVDILNLQRITYGKAYLAPIVSVLYDKGYTDAAVLQVYLEKCLDEHLSALRPAPVPKPVDELDAILDAYPTII